jgi:AcrR family transcriptional regulator
MMDIEKIDKKDSILDAAERLFSEIGYDACSTRSIAAKAGVNMAMLSYYFGSKDGLYKAVLERRLGIQEETFDAPTDKDSSWDQLYRYVDFEADQALTDIYFQKLIHRELSLQQRSDMTDYITGNITRTANDVKQLISKGIENGSFRNVDIELTVATIFGTIYYLVNSTRIASRVLNKDLENQQVIRDEIKPRLKKHLRDFLNSQLKRRQTED